MVIKNNKREIEEEIEQGVWIVYDLEANRKIQKLLIEKSFKFRFGSSLGIIKRQTTQEIINKIDKCKIHTAGALILIEKKELIQRLSQLNSQQSQELNRNVKSKSYEMEKNNSLGV